MWWFQPQEKETLNRKNISNYYCFVEGFPNKDFDRFIYEKTPICIKINIKKQVFKI